MGLLTMLGYTPLTPHQESRYKLWRDALDRFHREPGVAVALEYGGPREKPGSPFDWSYYAITHRHRKRDFAPGVTLPTEEDAARFFARLDEDPQTWIADIRRQWSEAHDEAMRPIHEHIARRKSMKTSLEQWDALSPIEFEDACADLLRRSGYADVRVTRASGEGGVDIIASKDGRRFAVQCKRYQHTIGPEPVRALAGVVASHPQKFSGGGIFMTTNWFSTAARREGREAKLTMISGSQLVAMAQAVDMPTATAETAAEGVA